MELISGGGAKADAKDKKAVSPAKKALSNFLGKKSPTNAARGSPGANKRGSPTANKRGSPTANKRGSPTANKRGSPGANKQKAALKVIKEKVEKKVVKTNKQAEDRHNESVKEENQGFVNKLVKQANKDEFEESEASVEDTWTNESFIDLDDNDQPKPKGELIVINVDLGMRGY